ncbi:hypothetical protein Hanom_Chr04g00345791 [Helianthus anomalus]
MCWSRLVLVIMSASHAAPGEVGKHCPSPSTQTNQSRMDLGCRRVSTHILFLCGHNPTLVTHTL